MAKKQTGIKVMVKGKVVGHVRGDTFYKEVYGSKHFLRSPRAIAMDAQSLNDAQKFGASRVEVVDLETKVVYKSTMSRIHDLGIPIDRGWGRQVALPLDDWSFRDFHQVEFRL
jgi:hypothetical protein